MSLPRHLKALLLILLTAAASWCGMMIVHESGHVIAALMTGGRVARVVLHPLAFSRTDLAENPHALLVASGGAVWGAAFPLALWGIARAARLRLTFLLRAFAGFCLIANGAYLASAAILPVGDAADLLRLGAPLGVIVPLGLVAFTGGLATWNGLGPRFGFNNQPVASDDILAVAIVFMTLVSGMLIWSWGNPAADAASFPP